MKKKHHYSTHLDKLRRAKHPGKRVSKAGKTYYETRRNRSDKHGYGASKRYRYKWL